jgi:hypothetical protein
MRRYCLFLLFFTCCIFNSAHAADASALFQSLRTKVLSVQDYTADVKMHINVSYMRIPQLNGTLYYKAPDKMRLERHGGLSILPKKNINLTLSNLIPGGNVTVIDMGNATIGTKGAESNTRRRKERHHTHQNLGRRDRPGSPAHRNHHPQRWHCNYGSGIWPLHQLLPARQSDHLHEPKRLQITQGCNNGL